MRCGRGSNPPSGSPGSSLWLGRWRPPLQGRQSWTHIPGMKQDSCTKCSPPGNRTPSPAASLHQAPHHRSTGYLVQPLGGHCCQPSRAGAQPKTQGWPGACPPHLSLPVTSKATRDTRDTGPGHPSSEALSSAHPPLPRATTFPHLDSHCVTAAAWQTQLLSPLLKQVVPCFSLPPHLPPFPQHRLPPSPARENCLPLLSSCSL